jgi:hypothetical protein
MSFLVNVGQALRELTIEEKVKLLSGRDNWSTQPVERLNIPSLTVCCCRARVNVWISHSHLPNRQQTDRMAHEARPSSMA